MIRNNNDTDINAVVKILDIDFIQTQEGIKFECQLCGDDEPRAHWYRCSNRIHCYRCNETHIPEFYLCKALGVHVKEAGWQIFKVLEKDQMLFNEDDWKLELKEQHINDGKQYSSSSIEELPIYKLTDKEKAQFLSQDYPEYFIDRGLNPDNVYKVLSKKYLKIVPFYRDEDLIGFQKFWYNFDTGKKEMITKGKVIPFNYNALKRDADHIIVVEGWSCALTLLQLGFNALALNGVNNAKKFEKEIRDSGLNVVWALDNDEAGRRVLTEVYKEGDNILIPQNKDFNEDLQLGVDIVELIEQQINTKKEVERAIYGF